MKREGNFEVLRVISIILIIMSHLASSIGWPDGYTNVNRYMSILFSSWGQLGVDCFFLISAYFLQKQKFRTIKLLQIVLETAFYILLMDILYTVFKANAILPGNGGGGSIFLSVLSRGFTEPLWSRSYWFATTYILLYITTPCLNNIFLNMNITVMKKMVVIMTVCIPTFSMFAASSVVLWYSFSVYIYVVSIYLKREEGNWFERNAVHGFVVTSVLFYLSVLILPMSPVWSEFLTNILANRNKGSTIMLLDAIFLFYIFKGIRIKSFKMVNLLASSALGIYLFHENQIFPIKDYFAQVLQEVYQVSDLLTLPFCAVLYILECIVILVSGYLVEQCRKIIVERPLLKYIQSKYGTYLKKIDEWMVI